MNYHFIRIKFTYHTDAAEAFKFEYKNAMLCSIQALENVELKDLYQGNIIAPGNAAMGLALEYNSKSKLIFNAGKCEAFAISLPGLAEKSVLKKDAITVEVIKPISGKTQVLPGKVIAGSRQKFNLSFLLKSEKIQENGKVRIYFPGHVMDVYSLKVKAPALPGLEVKPLVPYICECLPGRKLLSGKAFELAFGTRTLAQNNPITLEVDIKYQVYADPEFNGIIMIDHDGDDMFTPLETAFKINIHHGRLSHLRITAPSVSRKNTKLHVRVQFMDKYNNPVKYDYSGKTISVCLLDKNRKAIASLKNHLSGSGRNDLYYFNHTFKNAGIFYFEVKYGKLEGISNPAHIPDDLIDDRIYWGELHTHTIHSDGYSTVKFLYDYAEFVSLLDFRSIADHLKYTTEIGWKANQEGTCKRNKPGKFITFLGTEWGCMHGGDYNIYYKNDFLPPVREGMGIQAYVLNGKFINPVFKKGVNAVWNVLKRNKLDALTILHHAYHVITGKNSHGNDVYGGQKYEPVMEIYSEWGCSEYKNCPKYPVRQTSIDRFYAQYQLHKQNTEKFLYRDMLDKGWKVGVISGADDHRSMPGCLCFPRSDNEKKYRYPPGMTAVFAKSLSRDSIFKRIRQRACYATTGPRIIVEFEVNNIAMGKVFKCHHPKVSLKGLIAGTDKIKTIEIIKNGQVAKRFSPGTFSKQFEYIDNDRQNDKNENYYYLRIIQNNGEMAWSSPVWVKNQSA